jgi:putative lipoic acid-binding regulatory protein
MDDAEELLEFPCDFPIKVMGRNNAEFRQVATDIVQNHYSIDSASLREQTSRNGRFLSLTFTVNATGREGLDNLYRDLSADKRFLMVL